MAPKVCVRDALCITWAHVIMFHQDGSLCANANDNLAGIAKFEAQLCQASACTRNAQLWPGISNWTGYATCTIESSGLAELKPVQSSCPERENTSVMAPTKEAVATVAMVATKFRVEGSALARPYECVRNSNFVHSKVQLRKLSGKIVLLLGWRLDLFSESEFPLAQTQSYS